MATISRFLTVTLFLLSTYKFFHTDCARMFITCLHTTFRIPGSSVPLVKLLSECKLNENVSTATMLFYSLKKITLSQLQIFYKSVSMYSEPYVTSCTCQSDLTSSRVCLLLWQILGNGRKQGWVACSGLTVWL